MHTYTHEQTDLLIKAKSEVNFKDVFDKTALMGASTTEQTKLLIEADADIKDNEGNIAWDLCKYNE